MALKESGKRQTELCCDVKRIIERTGESGANNLQWLQEHMHPYFFITMKEEPEAVSLLVSQLQFLAENRRLILADREKSHILA